MSDGLNLKLDFLDASTFDSLRGPGSSSSEQIPTVSPDFHSHFPSSFDSHQSRRLEHTQPAASFDTLNEDNADSEIDAEVTKEDNCLHVVVVGGNVGAYATSLALAKSERVHVTLVNVGVGPFVSLGSESTAQASILSAREIAHLDELGRWDGSEHRGIQEDVSFDVGGGSNRWNGEGVNGQSSSIAERIQQEGIQLVAFALRRYSSGELLTFQEYSLPTGEDVSMTAIDTDAFLAVLRDTCLSHPRIDVRPRAIVRTVLSGLPAPVIAYHDRDNTSLTSKSHDGLSLGDSTPSNDLQTKRTGIGRRPGVSTCDRDRRRRARESFIQLEDDEQESPIQLFSGLSPVASTPISGVGESWDEILRNLPSEIRGHGPFSTEDLHSNATFEVSKSDMTFNAEQYKPVVVLTSGERVDADAIIGTEGPLSKVLEVIQSAGHGGNAYQPQMIREDGVYRAIIPILKVVRDPELCSLFVRGRRSGVSVTWPGPGQTLTAYPINSHSLHLSLIIKGGRAREDVIVDEDELMLALQMKREVLAWCPMVRKLFSFVKSASYEPVFDCNQLEQWVSPSGRVAVLGDAAHPPLSFAHQALSATISDAITLGLLLRKSLLQPIYLGELRSPHLIPPLLDAFVSIRRPLCLRTQLTLREGRDLLWLQDGEIQRGRDKTFRESGVYDEDEKRREWLKDPLETVERWWKDNASLFQRAGDVEGL